MCGLFRFGQAFVARVSLVGEWRLARATSPCPSVRRRGGTALRSGPSAAGMTRLPPDDDAAGMTRLPPAATAPSTRGGRTYLPPSPMCVCVRACACVPVPVPVSVPVSVSVRACVCLFVRACVCVCVGVGVQTLDDTSGKLLAVKLVPATALGAFRPDDLRLPLALRHPNLVRWVSTRGSAPAGRVARPAAAG